MRSSSINRIMPIGENATDGESCTEDRDSDASSEYVEIPAIVSAG